MQTLKLVLGSRNYSSWSLRAYLAARLSGLPFQVEWIHFDEDRDRTRRLQFSPTGKVPALHQGSLVVWDSLAICEYLAELAPERGLWPRDPAARAYGRSLVAEMHAGFLDLRRECPMNLRRKPGPRALSADAIADVARVSRLWEEARAKFGAKGPYLLGEASIADAFYAPVATRFFTYQVPLDGPALSYRDTLLVWQPLVEWTREAMEEGHPLANYDQQP